MKGGVFFLLLFLNLSAIVSLMAVPLHIQRLNTMFLADLGTQPRYQWIRGEDLWVPVSMKNDDGTQAYEDVLTDSGIWASLPVSYKFMYAEAYRGVVDPSTFNKAWVLCVETNCLLTPDEWRGIHPGVPFMPKAFTPADVHGRSVIQLTPTADQTRKLIDLVKMNRKRREELKTSKQLQYEDNAEWAKEQKAKFELGAAMGRERLVGGQFHTPGKKDGVSLPPIQLKEKVIN